MLRHVIAPSGRYTKASHDVVRHPRLNSDAKILLLYVQGLPDEAARKPLSELAQKLGIKGRGYQKAKEQLIAHGYVHEWRTQGGRGRWVTEQLVANLPLTGGQASGLRQDPPVAEVSPSARIPAVGGPTSRAAGGSTQGEDHCEKTTPHPPSEARAGDEPGRTAEPSPGPEPDPAQPPVQELAEAERVLLSLRHSRRELHLGVSEARALAADAAKWLLRGVTAADLRRVLIAELPHEGVRSAVGFLRHRLVQKLPDGPTAAAAPSPSPPRGAGLVTCQGPGDDHAFRPVADETTCASCRRTVAEAKPRDSALPATGYTPWRDRFTAINGSPGLPVAG